MFQQFLTCIPLDLHCSAGRCTAGAVPRLDVVFQEGPQVVIFFTGTGGCCCCLQWHIFCRPINKTGTLWCQRFYSSLSIALINKASLLKPWLQDGGHRREFTFFQATEFFTQISIQIVGKRDPNTRSCLGTFGRNDTPQHFGYRNCL